MQSQNTRRDLASAWDTVNQTKAALRHIENRLEAVPTSTAVIDTVMDTKKTLSSATRKISRKDGRYLEDSVASASAVKSSSRSKSRKDKTSRSPLRSTTLESNIKKSSRVEFRDPLAANRQVDVRVPTYLTASQLEAQRLLSELNANEVRGKESEISHMIYERDNRNYHCLDNESTRSTAVDDTEVKYLNDRSALDALHNSDALYKTLGRGALGQKGSTAKGPHAKLVSYESDAKSDRPSELSSPSSTSESMMQKLEMMRRKQHDDKLEKLKERIRKQREQSEESAERDRLLNFSELPAAPTVDTAAPTTKVRKVTAAPPAPSYKGFNPMETKIRTPDGKVWREDELHNISKDLYRDFTLQLAESSKVKEAACEKTKEKRITKPVRKVQKIARSPSPDTKPSSHVISTASWREGQKLVKMVLGPVPKTVKETEVAPSPRAGRERNVRPRNATRADSDTRLEASRKLRPRSSERRRAEQQPETDRTKEEGQNELDVLNTHVLPAEVRGILDDLQLKASHQDPEEKAGMEDGKKPTGVWASSRSVSPVKRKQEKPNLSMEMQMKRLRHYDAEEVRQYIARQQVERKKRQTEEKKAQKEAMEQKNKRLQELYRKQKEAFSKPKPETLCQKRLEETFSKYASEPAKVDELPHHQAAPEERQPRTVYQPSGESDKENKGQERPLSASSSSDMSLSEPLQPPGRRDRLESSWMPAHRLNLAAQPAHPHSGGNLFSHLPNVEPQGLLPKDFEKVANRKDAPLKAQMPSLQYPSSDSSPYDYTTVAQKSTVPHKSMLDRIEALKAMAASLSNRIESGTKKLAGVGINYGVAQSSAHDVIQTAWDDGRWVKTDSPPVRDSGEDDMPPRIRRILGANVGHTTYEDRLPGVGNLYEYKKFGDSPQCQTSLAAGTEARTSGTDRYHEVSWENTYKRSLEALEQDLQKLSRERNQFDSPHSSGGSISEGPLLSEGSLSEEDGLPNCRDPIKLTERLRDKEFCAGESSPSRPGAEFKKEAEKYQPLQLQSEGCKSRALWEELAKGSPHSVINIFTKSCQFYGKGGLEDESDGGSPTLQPMVSAATPEEVATYEDDFLSSQSSTSLSRKIPSYQSCASSLSSAQGELLSKRSHDARPGEVSPRSSGPRSTASSRSSGSSGKKMKIDVLAGTDVARSVRHSPVDDGTWASPSISDQSCSEGRMPGLEQGLVGDPEQVEDANCIVEEPSVHSPASVQAEASKPKKAASSLSYQYATSSISQRPLQNDTATAAGDGTRQLATTAFTPSPSPTYRPQFTDISVTAVRPSASSAAASMHSSPLSLQHRMTAELTYLDAIEESVRQLSEIDRTRGIALAQQETVSLAQILKAQQQRHEHDIALLKLKAEQETVASQRQLEETRQKAVQAHTESLQQFAQARQEMLQESTNKMMTQQVEAAKLTADAARQIKEMTELAYVQIVAGSPTVVTTNLSRGAAAVPVTALLDQQRQQHSDFMKQLRARTEPDRKSESSPTLAGPVEKLPYSKIHYSASVDSLSESSRYKHHDLSSDSSRQDSPSLPSSEKRAESRASRREKGDSSIEEEVHTAADDSIRSDSVPSLPDEKDSASIATEYSLKFDESMTEDEIEEKSFRSLLPSESHRRFNMERKRSRRDDSDEDLARDQSASTAVKHDLSMPFSGGQDSFSKFTMEMVRQYMKEEEMRAQHQVSLLKLRERALKEKTKAELAWLEHQKKHLRDKGEDDKMPPIRKRQRGLLLRLQQEQAEIKRLQEANRAAHKERQLILKQQQEIRRMRQTTIKIQEKLKSAGESKLEQRSTEQHDVENVSKVSHASSPLLTDVETRSPSPVSISGSETSSIMQKLKKMRSHMDEKFLTKREQKLMHRRRHAEELLEWKRRLDAEEAEIRRMEKQALAAWDKEVKQKVPKREASERSPGSKDTASEEECPAPSCSHAHSDSSIPEEVGSLPAQTVESASVVLRMSTSPDHSVFTDDCYSQNFESVATLNKQSPPSKVTVNTLKQDGQKSSSSLSVQIRPVQKSRQASGSWSDESVSVTQSETTSDQSDIESRIRALKDELRKRKSIVDKLKKEQKKRQKERLKAQEASLLKQLESYDEFIKKTQAELSKDLDVACSTKPQIKNLYSTGTEKPKIKPLSLQRTESAKSWKSLTEGERSKASLGSVAKHDQRLSSPEGQKSNCLSELQASDRSKSTIFDSRADESSRSPSPIFKCQVRSRPDFVEDPDNVLAFPHKKGAPESGFLPDQLVIRSEDGSGDESVVSSHRSMQDDVQEELENIKSEESDIDDLLGVSGQSDKSEPLLKIDSEKPQPLNISELIEGLTQRNIVLSDDTEPPFVVEHAEKNFDDLKGEECYLYKEGHTDEDEASDHSANSVKIVKSVKSDTSVGSVRSDYRTLDKMPPKNDSYDFECLSPAKETTYSEDFESSPRKEISEDLDESSHAGNYKDVAEVLLSRNEIAYNENLAESQVLSCPDHSKREEVGEEEKHSRSASPSIGMDDEISEQLSEKSFSSCGSVHSEKLLDLKSPTGKSRNEERSDAGNEEQTPVPSHSPSPCHTPTPTSHETDELPEFQIGARVLVSSIQPGTLRFKGRTNFANGFWAGVELDKPEGSNNGMYDGILYFSCKDKYGIFAPPHKISLLPECYDAIDITEDDDDPFLENKLDQDYKTCSGEEERPELAKEITKLQEEESDLRKTSGDQVDFKLTTFENNLNDQNASSQFSEPNTIDLVHIITESAKAVESFVCDQNLEAPRSGEEEQLAYLAYSNKDQGEEEFNPPDVPIEKASKTVTEMATDLLTEFSVHSSSETMEDISPAIHEKSSTPLLDLLNREKEQLEAQFRGPYLKPESEEIHEESEIFEGEELKDNEDSEDFNEDLKNFETKARSLADSIMSSFVKDAVEKWQQIKKSRDEKIHLTNQELQFTSAVESTPPKYLEVQNEPVQQLQICAERDDSDEDKEEVLSPDLCPRPFPDWSNSLSLSTLRQGSPVFGTSGQEELAKRLAELELSRELLDDLGDDQDWFDEDFGLSCHKAQQPVQEPQSPKTVPLKIREEPYFAVPHDALEVEKMVYAAAKELWKEQELGHDLRDMQIPPDYLGNNKGQDVESVSKRVYCEAVFNLTREIFSEIFAEDPNASQPPWMKPSRISSAYFRRVRNPQDFNEVKTFISNEVQKLFGFSKEQNQKTDWQKMMKFGRKKRDRVDHILVQELHEEEAQWVNYDEDELCVKMQLADGIFDALINDTVNVLNQIQAKQSKLTLP
ncbi:centrosome-associated protein 350 isoform X2 [Heterodontus francisci]|uniref:centrosome-associated protein 350 isoform X2 n=1 Tax=Heterodontus francisci TaxID=7792 RepID=UPI00355C2FA4